MADYNFRHQRKRNPSQLHPSAEKTSHVTNVLLTPPQTVKLPFEQRISIVKATQQLSDESEMALTPQLSSKTHKDQKEEEEKVPGDKDINKEVLPKQPEAMKEHPVIEMKDFEAVTSTDEKLNLIMVAINKINTNFHHKFKAVNKQLHEGEDAIVPQLKNCKSALEKCHKVLNNEQEGLLPRMRDAEASVEDLIQRVEKLETQSVELQDQIVCLKGATQVHDRKLNSMDNKITDLTARSMANNIIVQGITGDPGPDVKEDCKAKAINFLRNIMNMELQEQEVLMAHRLGYGKKGILNRNMVIKCQPALRDRIFGFTKNLKDIKNEKGDYYRVFSQLPEPLATQRQQRRDRINQIQKLNNQMEDETKKIKIQVKKGQLHLNGKVQKKYIQPPHLYRSVYN